MLAANPFLSGKAPGLSDTYVYYLIWFLRGRFSGGPGFLQEFQNILEWEKRVKEIGHGHMSEFSADDALDVARQRKPEAGHGIDMKDPLGLRQDAMVAVSSKQNPDEIVGKLITLNSDEVTILREDSNVGDVAVHLPRVGYSIRKI